MTEETTKFERRVVAAAEAAFATAKSVSPIDVLNQLGWLPGNLIDRWRQGRVDQLTDVLSVRPDRLHTALEIFTAWARNKGLQPIETNYVSATRDRRPLRFTDVGAESVELAFRTHWLSAELSDAQRERLTQRQNKPPDLVVVMPAQDWACANCHETGDFLIVDNAGSLCLTCADMDHLVFLPAGDAALSRRAKKASGLAAVVVRFNRSRKRYERKGILVEESALEQAEVQCLADEEARMRRRERDRQRRALADEDLKARMAEEISRLFPAAPPARAEAIARHAATRGSGRVGRSAAGRALDERAITLAVIASLRHEDTAYDELLMSGVPREEARDRIRADVDRLLERWRLSPA